MTSVIKQPSMLTKQVVYDGLSYILRGGLFIKKGHLPPNAHTIPNNFIGVCVASAPNPATDAYIISQLNALGIKQVRLDFSYGDLDGFNARFLHALIANNFAITLHIIQPMTAAKNMLSQTEQIIWQDFLQSVLNTFGNKVKLIEIGTTINRKRWAGYSYEGFLAAWNIAFNEIKARNIPLAGPNVQDFEPFYNISLLKSFKQKNLSPDIHSNNLFSERVNEPERYDHRVFKYRWASIFKYNLIKKARILQKIGKDFGIEELISPVAFWAIYRIQRRLPDGAEKQADYAARYFLLLAASGALLQANWGALICQREGLINDGLSESDYPDLERVAHYKSANGALANYQPYPSFNAVKTVAEMIQGAQYISAIASTNGLEIHHFMQGAKHIHVAWTINGEALLLNDIYQKHALQTAQILDRSGATLASNLGFITESPIYLIWDQIDKNLIKQSIDSAQKFTIHAHINNAQYFIFSEDGWRGLILAKDADEAKIITQRLHPNQLKSPTKDSALRHARNAIWAIEDPRNNAHQLTVKQPIKMYPHKAFLDRYKPSKAKRSWNGAMELMRRGISTARPIAYFEKINDQTLKQNFYICEFVQADTNIGQIFSALAAGQTTYLGMDAEEIYRQFALFCNNMHSRLIYFRDFSGGNILVSLNENKLEFSLIDTARLRTVSHTPFPVIYRIADLTRACHKLDWLGRERFMQIYLGLTGRKFIWQYHLLFYLYDGKVWLKRRIGRKGFKKLFKKFHAPK